MATVSVTSGGQVTIPTRIRRALGITSGSKIEFDIVGGHAQLRLVLRGASSRVEDGPAILGYQGPRIPIDELQGAVAVGKAAQRARR
ncbi:MAG: AbrB/MazE/SpoVT family DNA-binding domain-containing protein [Lysobacterales bacterium]